MKYFFKLLAGIGLLGFSLVAIGCTSGGSSSPVSNSSFFVNSSLAADTSEMAGVSDSLSSNVDVADTIGELKFTLNQDGASYSAKSYSSWIEGAVVIPAYYNGLPVTSIGGRAFANCKSLASVTIPDSVTSIGDYAFYGCASLASVALGEGIVTIGDYAFYGCASLASVTIPDSVTTIGKEAFEDCASLASVALGEGIVNIGERAFSGCDSLIYNEHHNALYLGGEKNPYVALVKTKDLFVDSCEPHADCKMIADLAFAGCASLTSVTIPDSVTTIGREAFRGCASLASVTIPDSATSIGKGAFKDCASLKDTYLMFSTIEGLLSTDKGSLAGHVHLIDKATGDEITDVAIPDGVTSIGDYAFSGCVFLTSVTIPDSVTTIGREAFRGCASLASITFNGTMGQWVAISKGSAWDVDIPAKVVHCSDGDASL